MTTLAFILGTILGWIAGFSFLVLAMIYCSNESYENLVKNIKNARNKRENLEELKGVDDE